MVALLTSVRNSPCFGGLRRTKTCHRQLFARPSTCFLVTFCTMQKVTSRSLCREHRGSANLESAHPNNTLPRTKLNPFETFRFAESLSLPGRHTPCAFSPPLAALFGRKAAERPHDRSAFAFLFAFAQIRLNLRKIHLVIWHTVLDGIRRHRTHTFAHTDADRHHAEVRMRLVRAGNVPSAKQ